jgi:small subunit ribosomal protein S1
MGLAPYPFFMINKNTFNHYCPTSDMIGAFETGENFAQLFEGRKTASIQEGTVVKGRVVKIENDLAIIDIETKNEGKVPLKEFQIIESDKIPEVGDIVEVYLDKIENRHGVTVLSRERAIREEYWAELNNAMQQKKQVNGVIFGKVKGGFTVDLNGVIGFLPGSQVDIRPVKDIGHLMGMPQSFMILKIDREQGNIVVSRRAILEGSRNEERDEVLSGIHENDILEGVVKNITDYGAFIDLGKVDGLLHVTDISWGRINHPSEVLTLGQTVKVQVIKFNPDNKRISLGMKQLESNPWVGIDERFPKGKKMRGKITNITDYGAFIELEPGIEGLVHVSEISWSKNNISPKKYLKLNQEVDYIILDIDSSKHRISLGMKQCSENPWQDFADSHPVGSVVEGTIRNVVDFGLFVGFDGDIDGLVHISDLAWSEDEALEALKNYKKDSNIQVKVLGIDVEKERISLGVKQMSENQSGGASRRSGQSSVSDSRSGLNRGDIVTCVVKQINSDSIDVVVNDALDLNIKKSDLAKDKSEQRPSNFAVGEKLDAKVVKVEKSGEVVLSVKALEIDRDNQAIKDYGSTDSGASLGDILGAAIEADKLKK